MAGWAGNPFGPFGMLFGNGAGGPPGQGMPQDPAQMLFGMPGFFGQGGADPAVVQELMQSMGLGFHMPGQAEPPRGPPATSAATIRSLPRIKVTAYDIAANESPECSICLSELVIGQPALRIPCGHLYHEECVEDWLKKSNECPVCRFELPTDNAEYEKGRKKRMQSRKIHLSHADLVMKSVQELRQLATVIGCDVSGCLEKSELVSRIASSTNIHIVAADVVEGSESTSSTSPSVATKALLSVAQLEEMSVPSIRALMEKLAVDASGCSEKVDLIRRLALAGRVIGGIAAVEATFLSEAEAEGKSGVRDMDLGAARPDAAATDRVFAEGSAVNHELSAKSVGQLRQLAKSVNVSLDGCLEKGDIIERIQAAQRSVNSL